MSKSIIRVKHRGLGNIEIQVDPEDYQMMKSIEVFVKSETGRKVPPYLLVIGKDGKRMNASRFILKQHKLLQKDKHVFFKDGNSFILCKNNLIQYT